MSYQSDDGQHEGWEAAEFPDGRLSVGSGNGGVLVRFLDPRLDHDGEPDAVDGRTAIGWRGVCTCGWRGPLWERVAVPVERPVALLDGADGTRVDWDARKVFDPDPNEWATAPGPVEDAIYQEWRGHLPPPALADVRAAAEDVRKAEARLDDAVARARAEYASWADIGAAAGMARQSAHERWGRR